MTAQTAASPRRRIAVTIAMIVTLLGTATGCGAFETPQARPCAWLGKTDNDRDVGTAHTAVLVDRTASTRAGRDTPAGREVPDWPATVLAADYLAPEALEGGDLSVSGFDGTRTSIGWEVDRAVVTPVRGVARRRADERQRRTNCLRQRIGEVAGGTARTPNTDLLGALAATREQLGPQGRRRVLVATDGLVNTGCADLRSVGFDRAEIATIIESCARAGELPDLAGIDVAIRGIGHLGTGNPPSSPQTAWLVDLWQGMCAAAKAASCRVEGAARIVSAGGPADPLAEPAIDFPTGRTTTAGPVTTIVLPDSLLFATDRAELSPEALAQLDDAAHRLIGLGRVRVVVTGNTDSRGSKARGEELSQARADAVRTELLKRGVTDVTARGDADRHPMCSPEYRGTVPDYRAMACNRRVEIVATVQP
ncbi:OmpA family protein [Embleya sp. NPDC005971]|uniref:OmpA family protein n=1 Tax=Embleya sp. NPDC005971 TaxID=3156724 RepID=UPI00340177CC